MPSRQNTLKEILIDAFGEGQCLPREQYLDSPFHEEISFVYKELGGRLSIYPTGFRGFDIKLKGFVVELDEEQHFNRYRHFTLLSQFYKSESVKEYREYCSEFEENCLARARYGNYWRTDSTDKQFGPSELNGTLDGAGSSRWKQRAFYDYLRDVGAKMAGYQLVRISIYDRVDRVRIGDILQNRKRDLYNRVVDLVRSKRTD